MFTGGLSALNGVSLSLCEEHGCTYEWASGQKPHLTKDGKNIRCKTENFVLLVVLGLSSSSTKLILDIVAAGFIKIIESSKFTKQRRGTTRKLAQGSSWKQLARSSRMAGEFHREPREREK